MRGSRAVGGIERAGDISTGWGGATWRVGMGEGTRSLSLLGCAGAWALRAGVVARARLTTVAAFECFTDTVLAFLPLDRLLA